MRLLWIATKSPWPPRDGGRLLLLETLRALAGSGCEIALVAPRPPAEDLRAAETALAGLCAPRWVGAGPLPRGLALVLAALGGTPYSIRRHRRAAGAAAVEAALAAGPWDAVVAEQLQAFAQSAPAIRRAVPVVLRAQNVESDLWRQLAERSRGWRRGALGREARRLAAAETEAVRRARITLALSSRDAQMLATLVPGAPVEALAPPFPERLPAASGSLAGDPAVVLFGSTDWEPNRRAVARFLETSWPRIFAVRPAARLHLFGAPSDAPGVVAHERPKESAEAFARGSILVLPLDVASGVRMRILEAWARGIPVVATSAAASGLEATDGAELRIADGTAAFVAAFEELAFRPETAARLVAGGRTRLASTHAPGRFAGRFLALLEAR